MRLRQAVLAAHDLESVVAAATAVLDIEVSFRDPGVAVFGLQNAVMPVADTFLEIVSPVRDDAPAARFLARKGGDAGYMIMLQTDDLCADRRRISELGIREVFETSLDDIAGVHLHPRDIGATILSLDQPSPPTDWRWAGPDWPALRRTALVEALRAVEIATADPAALASRWAHVLGRRRSPHPAGAAIALDDGSEIRFVAPPTGHGEGLVAIELAARNPSEILERARRQGLACAQDAFTLCDTLIRLRKHPTDG